MVKSIKVPMSAQDRISQLCEQALEPEGARRSVSPQVAAALEKFNLAPASIEEDDQPRVAAQAVAKPAAESAATTEASDPAEKAEAAPAAAEEEDPELRAMLEERDLRLRARSKRRRLVANCVVLLVCGVSAAAFVISPTLRGKLDTLVHHLQGGVKDVKSMANMAGSYDEALEGVAQRGAHIDDATAALGVDPASVSEDEDPNMQAELDEMMGEGNRTVGERNASLANAGKIVTAVTGRTAPEVKKEED